jgi:hypothetical protein
MNERSIGLLAFPAAEDTSQEEICLLIDWSQLAPNLHTILCMGSPNHFYCICPLGTAEQPVLVQFPGQ